jgi:HAD superfamily hydrolase (TIGR01549 family)
LPNQHFSGVVFDLDNTLVSSSLNFNEIKSAIKCPEEFDILDYIESLSDVEKSKANQLVHQYEMDDANTAKKLAGVDEILSLLERLGIPCAIVTRNNKTAASIKLRNNAIEVPLLLTRENFNAKPAPDALIYVAKQWQVSLDKVLCVGDYLYDIQMANNANTLSCLVSYGHEIDYAHLATFVVDDMPALKQHILNIYDD